MGGRLSTKRLAMLLTRLLSKELDHRTRRRLYSTTTFTYSEDPTAG